MELDNLIARLYRYELPAAIICILTPFILAVFNGEALDSISEYAYSEIAHLYVFLVTVASTLIVTIGTKNNEPVTWLSGLALMLIPLSPYMEYPTLHLIGTLLFFIGIVGSMWLYSNLNQITKGVATFLIVLAFAGNFIFNKITLFESETLGLLLMGVYLIIRIITDKKQYENG